MAVTPVKSKRSSPLGFIFENHSRIPRATVSHELAVVLRRNDRTVEFNKNVSSSKWVIFRVFHQAPADHSATQREVSEQDIGAG